ncbi:guanine nucleotide exchange protein for ADP-robosylation factor [Oleoguttula sp. CCFEE 5521]
MADSEEQGRMSEATYGHAGGPGVDGVGERPEVGSSEEHVNGENTADETPPKESTDETAGSNGTAHPAKDGQRPADGSDAHDVGRPTAQDPSPQSTAPPTAPDTPSTPAAYTPRIRTDSQSTTATNTTTATRGGSKSTRSSLVFVVSALESIAASKDARKRKPLLDSTQRALSAIRNAQGDASQLNPETLFEPLNLATEATTVSVVTTALDCIGKLISYSYFSVPQRNNPEDPHQKAPLIERAIDTICDCFQGEATPAEVQMQIIKSLLAAILNDKIVVHGAGLLKSVRQTYNIFLLSKNGANQQIAQGTLTQMVGTVFERVKARLAGKAIRAAGSKTSLGQSKAASSSSAVDTPTGANGSETPMVEEPETPADAEGETTTLTLQDFEKTKTFDDTRINDTTTVVTRAKRSHVKQPSRTASGMEIPAITVQGENSEMYTEDEDEDEIYIRDAFLVFRAMCKLSTKQVRREEEVDIRSQGMRSKLLSLHIIHTVLFHHHQVFTNPNATIRSSSGQEPTGFTQAIKQYLCLSLSKNASSAVRQVFEVSAELFWLMTKYLRSQLKPELQVFLKEVYLTILEKRLAPPWQKSYIVQNIFGRIAGDPKALVEIYLNYDCDRQALDNMYQRIIEHVSRIAGQPAPVTALQQQAYSEYNVRKAASASSDWQQRGNLPSNLVPSSTPTPFDIEDFPQDYAMKMQALDALVVVLISLVNWGQQGTLDAARPLGTDSDSRRSADDTRESTDTRGDASSISPTVNSLDGTTTHTSLSNEALQDDPAELEKVKERKTALNKAVQQFNFKPKKGIQALLQEGFIASRDAKDIAAFFLSNDQISKKALGEYLGEGDDENKLIMAAFVDGMDFSKTRFVDALRRFLQSFRLPGEAQKIDRLMLKFAEKYTAGNPNAFANADTAYILSYSVIMLNTDQHSAQVKQRMTIEDFIKNNRGINDGASLPDEYLQGVYDEIQRNEIVLDTERAQAAELGQLPQANAGGIQGALATFGRDLSREAYAAASEEMRNRTEQLFKTMLKAQKKTSGGQRSNFLTASSFRHVGPMFHATWMSFLTALSGTAQETQHLETIRLCMEGQKLAVRLACLFDLADPRQAFVSSLARSTNLYNLSEMKAKNVEALRVMLEVANTEGNLLKESWRDILTCISQLDRFQLISSGVEEGAVPDVARVHSISASQQLNGNPSRKSMQVQRRPTPRPGPAGSYHADIAEEARSAEMIRSVDRIFTNTANLSGDAIVHFVRALTQVSWQEIQSSGQSESPRTYSLQKLVEISGYNMLRVRFEWTNIWQVLGQHFIDVGCHNNTHVVYFALNSLRQLSMRFMEIEELPGFRFQKDFLKPFELILRNASQVQVKDMVLRCLIQMIQARGDMIRSGWRTMFGVFTVAAREPYESIVNLAFDNVTQVYNARFGVVISQGAFADLIVCLTEFSKNMKFQKKSLQAIETLKGTVPKMLRTPECPLSVKAVGSKDAPTAEGVPRQPSRQTQEEQYWFPVLFAFHDVLMTGEDLEVRSRALNYLFDTLTKYGGEFPRDFWDTLWRQLLYPIFMVLKDRKAINQEAANHEELSVWLSTTLIQALRNMITLFTHFFESLEYMLDRFLDLLALCICQENDTLARIGSNCLQQLILQNVRKFTPQHWEKIVGAFVDLFGRTEARELFSAATSSSYGKESSYVNGFGDSAHVAPVSSSGIATEDAPSITSGTNALKINGIPADTPSDVPTTNGHAPPAADQFQRRPSNALSLSSTDYDHSPAPPPKPSSSNDNLESFASPTLSATQNPQQTPVIVTAARRRYFNQIITKCVLQLLMIETVSELFSNNLVYASIPSPLLLQLMALLKRSYHFAKRFNADRELRARLFREGFMRQPPNLLKQESGSASVYVLILLRMYADTSPERAASRLDTEEALIPLCSDILASYIALDDETQQRNIVTWRPVVVDVLEGYVAFADGEFGKHVSVFAPLCVGLMGREMGGELQRGVMGVWKRVCETRLGVDPETWDGMGLAKEGKDGLASPRAGSFAVRRGSRVGSR